MSTAPPLPTDARPTWQRTGRREFPYAAEYLGRWWVLRFNHGFPEHDLYTLFVDGRVVLDVTGNPDSDVALVASVGALTSTAILPTLNTEVAQSILAPLAGLVNYGSEVGDPCDFCS